MQLPLDLMSMQEYTRHFVKTFIRVVAHAHLSLSTLHSLLRQITNDLEDLAERFSNADSVSRLQHLIAFYTSQKS